MSDHSESSKNVVKRSQAFFFVNGLLVLNDILESLNGFDFESAALTISSGKKVILNIWLI